MKQPIAVCALAELEADRGHRVLVNGRRLALFLHQGEIYALEDRCLLTAPHPVDLSALDGANGFRVDGVDPGDELGLCVRRAGDENRSSRLGRKDRATRATGRAAPSVRPAT